MEARFEALVEALQGRLGENGSACHPSHFYGVAWELANALTAVERRRQLHRLFAFFEESRDDCTVGCVVSAAALLCAGGLVAEDALRRWEEAMHSILLLHPPFPKDIVSSVCFCIAQVAVCGHSVGLIEAAGVSPKDFSASTRLSDEVVTEILVECTDALLKRLEEDAKGDTGGNAREHFVKLRDALVGYALDVLSFKRGDVVATSLLSRRVLIPLLLYSGHDSLTSHQSRIHCLLQSLAEERTCQGEVVILVAALFEYLLRFTDVEKELDYRCSPYLWNSLYAALWDAFTCDADAGRRANMQLRVEYLLKRIVDFTHEQEVQQKWTRNVLFHKYFLWIPTISHNLWGRFFLVLEATNEFGLHIVQPALSKLDALVESLTLDATAWCTMGNGDDDDVVLASQFVSGFHPIWVEMLFLKMLRHPNTAIRKVALRRLLSISTAALRLFSTVFLCKVALEASLDSRLCEDVDRVSHAAALTMTTGFEGPEVRALEGLAGPLADELERFYARIFRDVLRTAAERKEAMCRLLHVLVERPSVYGATMLLRILHGVAEALSRVEEESCRAMTLEMITDPDVLQEMLVFLRDVLHDGTPFWLDVRLSAIAFSTLLHFARVNPTVVRQSDDYWKLLCLCGPLGNPGGINASSIDFVGHIGSVGTCIHPRFLNEQLIQISTAVPIKGNDFGFMRILLRTGRLLGDVRQFLRSASFGEACGKQLLFLCGALHMAESEDRQLLKEVAEEISATFLSFVRRPYSSPGCLLTALSAFVEFHHSVGTMACIQYYSMSTILDLTDTLHTVAFSALRQAIQAVAALNSFGDFVDDVWMLQHTSEWDVILAATLSTGQITLAHDPTGRTLWVRTREYMTQLLQLLNSDINLSAAVGSFDDTTKMTQHFAKMVLARNISRLLQGVLCGLIPLDTSASDMEGLNTTEVACHSLIDAADPVTWIRGIMRCPSLRLLTCDVPCPLTGLSWATLLAQYYGGLYNAVFILCGLVDPKKNPDLVLELQDYALDHVERCWGTNLASVYDILAWVANSTTTMDDNDNNGNVEGVDHRAIINAMLGHLRDVGARDHGRVSLLALSALRCGVVEHEDLVKAHISQTLLDEAESERSMYLAAVTISTEVLRAPLTNWPRLKDLLLHVSVLYNPGRDEEASEMMVAATEPLLLCWPEALRVQYPPTVRLSSVGRALTVSTILWCCHLRHEWAVELSLELLDWNISHPTVNHEPCMPNSKPHRCRIRLWQLLCSLLPMIDSPVAQHNILQKAVTKCLPLTNMGSVRRLMELYTLKILGCQPALYTVLDKAVSGYNLRPQVCGSYLLIMAHMILQQLRGDVEHVEGLFEVLLHRLFQHSTSHQHLLRIISHVGLHHIHEMCVKRGTATFHPTEEMIFDYIARANEHVKFREKHSEQLFFNLAEACSPHQLFCMQRREGNTLLSECIPAAAFERMRFLDNEFRSLIGAVGPVEMLRVRRITNYINTHCLLDETFREFPYIPHTEGHTTYCVDYTAEALALVVANNNTVNVNNKRESNNNNNNNNNALEKDENIQRKVTPWWSSMVYDELHPRALKQKQRQSVIVISSLLQNPVNVAGLFRCGEIFTVEKIVVADPTVFEHPHFIAAARSAELWLPWEAVQAKNLSAYMNSLRRDGFTLIGIEQTAGSVSIASYKFPERAVILLGEEGHGVPAELLPVLDVCVEIPQFGLIRSLNVHVTGALVMYEYTRQHLMK